MSKKCITRKSTDSHLKDLVGCGKEFVVSELPTMRAVLQLGILFKEKEIILKEKSSNNITVKHIANNVAPLFLEQCQVQTSCYNTREKSCKKH